MESLTASMKETRVPKSDAMGFAAPGKEARDAHAAFERRARVARSLPRMKSGTACRRPVRGGTGTLAAPSGEFRTSLGGSCIMAHEHGEKEKFWLDNRELILREDILQRAKELANLLAGTEEVRLYQEAERKIRENERVQSLIAQIKKKQKELVAFQTTFRNQQMAEKIEKEIEALQDELDEIPLVRQFQQSQVDVNYMLQSVVGIIRDTLAEIVDLEAARQTEQAARTEP